MTASPTLAVWKVLLSSPHPSAALTRLGHYFLRRYPDQKVGGVIGTLPAFSRDVDTLGGVTYEAVTDFAGFWPAFYFAKLEPYSLSAPLDRFKPFYAQLLACGGFTELRVRVLPATGVQRGVDFEVRDEYSNDLVEDEVTREHAEALIHLRDAL